MRTVLFYYFVFVFERKQAYCTDLVKSTLSVLLYYIYLLICCILLYFSYSIVFVFFFLFCCSFYFIIFYFIWKLEAKIAKIMDCYTGTIWSQNIEADFVWMFILDICWVQFKVPGDGFNSRAFENFTWIRGVSVKL